jgi:hypothetical protein
LHACASLLTMLLSSIMRLRRRSRRSINATPSMLKLPTKRNSSSSYDIARLRFSIIGAGEAPCFELDADRSAGGWTAGMRRAGEHGDRIQSSIGEATMKNVYEEIDKPAPARTRRPILALLAGIVIGFLLLSAVAHLARGGIWNRFAGFMTGRATRVDVSQPAVVDRIRRLSRLETVAFSLDKIVEGERESSFLPDFLVGEKLLLIAHGEVTAGIDLDQLKPSDVVVHGDSVQVRLPTPVVLSTRLDNQKTRIYSRTTGLLVSADPNLETQVRQAAEQQITQAALADGILDKAHQSACAGIAALLSGLGFKNVDVE